MNTSIEILVAETCASCRAVTARIAANPRDLAVLCEVLGVLSRFEEVLIEAGAVATLAQAQALAPLYRTVIELRSGVLDLVEQQTLAALQESRLATKH